MSSYAAVVCKIQTRPHPNADRLQLGTAHGYQVVLGKDVQDGELGIFFPCDGQLSDDFCKANNLYPQFDAEGKRVGGGFFDPKNRRVRAQKFRGEKSDGYWCKIDSLYYLISHLQRTGEVTKEFAEKVAQFHGALRSLSEGDQFTSIAGIEICNKYFNEATQNAQKQTQVKALKNNNPLFVKHVDTKQLKHELNNIPDGSLIYLSEKVHGTSGRYAYLPEKIVYQGWKGKLLGAVLWCLTKLIGVRPSLTDYKFLVGSRTVQLKQTNSNKSGWYGDDQFRYEAVPQLGNDVSCNLHKGEQIYGEIVGFTTNNKAIQSAPMDRSEDPELAKRYPGERMVYKYGAEPGKAKFFVYRITRINEDGVLTELSVPQVKARCRELGLTYVPEFIQGAFIFEKEETEYLLSVIQGYVDGPSTLDPSHIREGVVLRIETPDGQIYFLKEVSHTFKVLEGKAKDQANYVDVEESA